MNLRTKFAWVLGLLAATLTVNVGVSVWGVRFLQRELTWPLESIQSVMAGLQIVKQAGQTQSALVGLGRDTDLDPPLVGDAPREQRVRDRFMSLNAEITAALDRLDALPSYLTRAGVSTDRNLRARSESIRNSARAWFETGDDTARIALAADIWVRHELIERIEQRIVADAALAIDQGESLRVLVLVIIGVSVAGAGAVATLMTLLVRRWVLVPVEQLRHGAERLGQGLFDHRIRVAAGDELGRLGEEFNTMAALIKRMQDERVERERLAAVGEMARRIVHNLRTPLAGIRALAETTRNELPPGSDLVDVQDRVIGSVDRFEGWLRDMLAVSSPLELHCRRFDPRTLVSGVADAHVDAARAKGVVVRFEDRGLPPTASGDPHHLEHALTALASNAVEFAPAGSEILIEGLSDEAGWTVRMTDSGPGVPSDLQQAVFRPYFTTRAGGTGIGLALVKRVADQHGGTVTVQSPVDAISGSGTAFSLFVPFQGIAEVE